MNIRYYQIGSTYYRISEDKNITNLAITHNISSSPAKHDIILAVYRPSVDELDGINRAILKGIIRSITQEEFEIHFKEARITL